MADTPDFTTMKLSPLDQIMPRTYIRLLLCFPFDGDGTSFTNALQLSVDSLISQIPYLGTNLRPNADKKTGRLEVFAEKPHVSVHVKHSREFEYFELASAGMPINRLDNTLTPVSVFADPASQQPCPALAIQVSFIKGGLLLCICVHHAIMDGTGVGTLVGMLARSTADGGDFQIPGLPGILDRSPFFTGLPHKEPPKSHPEYKIVDLSTPPPSSTTPTLPPMTTRLFHFSTFSLSSLKAHLTSHLPLPTSPANAERFISTNDALTALLFSCVTRARLPHLEPSSSSRLGMAVNARRHLNPPLPAAYLGNVNLFATSLLPVSTLTATDATSLATVALSVREAIIAVDDHHVKSAISFINSVTDVRTIQYGFNSFLGPDLAVTSWEGMGVYGHDWGHGLGKPEWVRTVTSGNGFDGLGIVLPRRMVDGMEGRGGLEVMLGLRSDDMERLEKDEVWKEYCGGIYE